ncbi:SDR family NAD(P)-dependent oxidoreductase [Kocuria sp. NPDC057446]|uniref:SDR family NAD(P)-dependent oxidoreductase n=1 Tax=Kocuria sp. NPDC057446 TaxID=3346137 RepID=UPI00367DDA93
MITPAHEPPRVALVTGAGSGIGAAAAEALSSAGWQVVICGRRAEALEAVAAATGAVPLIADVTAPEVPRRLVEQTVERFGHLDGLVLNAGIVRPGTTGELTDEDWQAQLDTNLTAPFALTRAALPHLIERSGAVVGVASVSALRASGGTVGYNVTKAGLSMLMQSVAVDHGPAGVRANVVCPGWTRTEMADEEMAELGKERGLDVEKSYGLATAVLPTPRPADSAEIASVITWLLSPGASYINGAVIPVDGGLTAVDVGGLCFDPRVSIAASAHGADSLGR